MATVDHVSSFSVQSALELVTDSWEARLASASRFLTRTQDDRITIQAGLTGDLATLIDSGVVREYALDVTPDAVSLALRGFDQGKLALEKRIRRLYRRSSFGFISTGPGARGATLSAQTPAAGELPISEGVWTARSVAEDICGRKGITLVWQAPDYELVQDFSAVGRVVDVISQLVAPWGEVPGPSRVDVYFVGTQLVVRQRGQVGEEVWTVTVGDAGLLALNLVARPTFPSGMPGLVIVRGRPSTATVSSPGSSVTEIEADTQDVRITTTYREPDHSLLSMETVYKFAAGAPAPTGSAELITRETVTNEWEPAQYDAGRPVNQPRLLSSERATFGRRGDASGVIQLRRDRMDAYLDDEGFLVSQRNFTQAYQPAAGSTAAGLKDASLKVRTLVEAGPQVWVDTHASYGPDTDGRLLVASSGAIRDWPIAKGATRRLDQADPIAGYRPFGPGRRNPNASGGQNPPTTVTRTIPGGDEDYVVEINGEPHLDALSCAVIADTFVRAAATPWELEYSFTALSIPWLRRGSKIRITGVLTEDGDPVELPAALITELDFDHDEAAGRALMRGRAICWVE
jgi:hypothetical protein